MELIDIHNHIAWNVDDGIKTKKAAQETLLRAKEDGIRRIVATPHIIPGRQSYDDFLNIKKRISEVQVIAEQQGITIYPGSEVMLNDAYLDWLDKGWFYTLANSRYVLCEFDVGKDIALNEKAEDQLYEISIRGLVPVIAHIERYFHSGVDMDRVRQWMQNRYVLQMNRTSLLGMHGKQIQRNAKKLLKAGLIHVIASDAHHVDRGRISRLSDVYHIVEKKMGQTAAELLFYTNPLHLLHDEDVERLSGTRHILRLNGRRRRWDYE